MDEIRNFLLSPEEYLDTFWESDELIWVDWREYDESIIKYINEKLPDEDKVKFSCVEIEKERDLDIILEKDGISTTIPYAEDYTDRDTTLKSVQEYVSPKYQIRWFMGSLGSDTLAFCVFPSAQWWTIVNKKDTIFKYIFWERLDSLPIPECCFHFVWCQIA